MVFAAEGEQKPEEKNSPLQWKPLSRRVSVADLGCSSLWIRMMLLVRVRVRVIFKLNVVVMTRRWRKSSHKSVALITTRALGPSSSRSDEGAQL